MIDGEVRELGRRARADDDPDARLAWIVARLRAGLPRERLFLAAWAGDAQAARLLGRAAPMSPEGPLHLGTQQAPGVNRARIRAFDAVVQNAGKHACVDLLCAAIDAALACDATLAVDGARVGVAAARAWRVARGRIALGERAAELQRAVAALTEAAGLSPRTVAGVVALPRSSQSQPWFDGPPPVQIGLACELILAITRDGSHRFGVLAAHALRAVSTAAKGAPAVDAAARAALIAFALR